LTIARRCALDYLRTRGVQTRLCESFGFEHSESSSYPSPADILLDKENMRIVVGALAKLGVNQKRVIEMAYYRGLTQSQIASELHQPLGTVKSWARSALCALRSDVEQTAGLARTA
jgi:RNA polymerase sigma-70 factor (ECF subfamily)